MIICHVILLQNELFETNPHKLSPNSAAAQLYGDFSTFSSSTLAESCLQFLHIHHKIVRCTTSEETI